MIPDLAGTAAAVEITIDEIRRIANTTIPTASVRATPSYMCIPPSEPAWSRAQDTRLHVAGSAEPAVGPDQPQRDWFWFSVDW